MLHNRPCFRIADLAVAVDQDVPKTNDLAPVTYFRRQRRVDFGKLRERLANNLKTPLDRPPKLPVREIVSHRFVLGKCNDLLRRIAHVPEKFARFRRHRADQGAYPRPLGTAGSPPPPALRGRFLAPANPPNRATA